MLEDYRQHDLEDVPHSLEDNPSYKRHYLWFVIFFSVIGGFLFGYDTGVISGAMLFMETYFELTAAQKELVVSIALLGKL